MTYEKEYFLTRKKRLILRRYLISFVVVFVSCDLRISLYDEAVKQSFPKILNKELKKNKIRRVIKIWKEIYNLNLASS